MYSMIAVLAIRRLGQEWRWISYCFSVQTKLSAMQLS
jgi:hypothetical protein